MLKKEIEYTDYNDVTRKEPFYFNLTQAEIAKMELSTAGGLVEAIERMVVAQDGAQIMNFFEKLILTAYGVKSPDGKRFEKSEELSRAFLQTEAYSVLFMELVTNPEKAAAFVNGIVPQAPVEAKQA